MMGGGGGGWGQKGEEGRGGEDKGEERANRKMGEYYFISGGLCVA